MKYVLFFCVMLFTLIVECVWVKYLQYVAQNKPGKAAAMSALSRLSSIISIGAVMHDRQYVVPVIAGSFFGTYLSVRLSRKQ